MEQNRPLVEMLGSPKTVRMRGRFPMANGRIVDIEAPTECWISALVYTLPPEQLSVFITKLQRMLELRDNQTGVGKARVVAEIAMPDMVT